MKPETHISIVKPALEELVNWYLLHKPEVKRVFLRRADWRCLQQNPEVARRCGFDIADGVVSFKGLKLEPTDCGAHHAPSGLNPYK
jgi:hypothetical protein